MNNWLYENKVIEKIEDFPENTFGFVYRITNLTNGKFYIGKKQLLSQTNVKLGKKEIAALPTQRGRTPSKKLVVKESNWQEYWGSNKLILEEIKQGGTTAFRKEILKFCFNKKQLTYWELHFQCVNEVLVSDKSYNDNILAKFFRRDLE